MSINNTTGIDQKEKSSKHSLKKGHSNLRHFCLKFFVDKLFNWLINPVQNNKWDVKRTEYIYRESFFCVLSRGNWMQQKYWWCSRKLSERLVPMLIVKCKESQTKTVPCGWQWKIVDLACNPWKLLVQKQTVQSLLVPLLLAGCDSGPSRAWTCQDCNNLWLLFFLDAIELKD